ADRTWVVCGRDHAEPVRAALPALPPAHLLVEPAARNTAPAIGLAAVRAVREDPDAVLLVLPSDHYIAHQDRFLSALQTAARVAQQGDLVTLGIRPTRPETGYGYLRRGAEREPGVFAVEAFVEKPDAKTAQKYLEDPRYSWNAGIFVFRAGGRGAGGPAAAPAGGARRAPAERRRPRPHGGGLPAAARH